MTKVKLALSFVAFASLASCADRSSSVRSSGTSAPDGKGAPLVALGAGVFIEQSASAEERAHLATWSSQARAEVASFFGGPATEPPDVIACVSDPCAVAFTGPTRRHRATMTPRPAVMVNGVGALTKETLVHEMIHIELAQKSRRSGRWLPAWFEEGVATFIGNNGRCRPDTPRAIDDLRRLSSSEAWGNFTNQPGNLDATYCQARDEIAAWVSRRDRKALIVAIEDVVIRGRPFEDVYGALLIRPSPNDQNASLVGRFLLDENAGVSTADTSGHKHVASLFGGASWTSGRRGSAVKVTGGGHLRADGFIDLGLPDKAFSITLWVKSQANAKVLVHTSANASGGDGWCVPLLGHDAGGHLVAQVLFGPEPHAFLVARGPVLAVDDWHHVAMTWSEDVGVRLYVDGAIAASAPPKAAVERHRHAPATPLHLFFGSDNAARCWSADVEPGNFNGVIDEIGIHNYELDAKQVASGAAR